MPQLKKTGNCECRGYRRSVMSIRVELGKTDDEIRPSSHMLTTGTAEEAELEVTLRACW